MTIRENIIQLREMFDLTQDELAKIAGVTRGAVSQWEGGFSEPRMGSIQRIADHFQIMKSNIIEENGMKLIDPVTRKPKSPMPQNARPVTGMKMGLAPRLGRVHAGVLTEPETYDEATMVKVPDFLLEEDPECFVVSSEGDCMDKVFPEGSDLVVSKKKEPRDNSIVIASVDGSDYIVRRLRLTANTMILSPESHNPEHEDIIIRRDSDHAVEIPGVIVWYQAPREME